MKKLCKIIAIVFLVLGAFCLGHAHGVYTHKMNQIIYDENGTPGTYYSEYHGDVDSYWYE